MSTAPKRRGRPRKEPTPGEDASTVAKRLYMRDYQTSVRQGVVAVMTAEEECDKERDALRKRVTTLMATLNSSMNQLDTVLKEATAMPKKKPSKKELLAKGQAIATKMVSDMKAKKKNNK